jgi:hypothetical protein
MNESEQFDSPAIAPIYSQRAPNDPIEYGSFLIEAGGAEGSSSGQTLAVFRERFSRNNDLEIIVPEPTETSSNEGSRKDWLRVMAQIPTITQNARRFRLVDFGTDVDAFCVYAGHDKSIFHPDHTPLQVHPPSNSLTMAVFHLFNWPQVFDPESYAPRIGTGRHFGADESGSIRLEYDNWIITVTELENTAGLVKKLEEKGGYAITHVGRIARSSGQPFTTKELNELLECIGYFFSLVLGRWNRPSLTVGFDSVGSRVFEHWGMLQITAGHYVKGDSFFDTGHASIFNALFPSFWQLWNAPLWHDTLKKAIYWYVGANNVGFGVNVDSALLFTQAALELLAWTYCVMDKKAVSEKAFAPRGGLTASDKLTLLTTLMEIPSNIPLQLKSLSAGPNQKWSNSMHVITDLRNGLVHPKETKGISDNTYYEAWRLSLWYLDLILLRLLGYQGKYFNRLMTPIVGRVEDVPWV